MWGSPRLHWGGQAGGPGEAGAIGWGLWWGRNVTCTPRIPKMMKKAQQMSTMLPMGRREEMRVSTTSFSPGARLMTLERKHRPAVRSGRLRSEGGTEVLLCDGSPGAVFMGKGKKVP